MAKNDRNGNDQAHVKLRVFEFEIDGSNASVQETVRNIAATLGRTAPTREPLRKATAAESNGSTLTVEAAPSDVDSEDDVAEEAVSIAPASKRRATRPAKPAKLNVVPVDFEKAKLPLKDFFKGVEVNSTARKFTMIAAWFKQELQLDAIDAHQVLTAYKHLGWTDMPTVPRSTFSDLINGKSYKWFGAGKDRGTYSINFIGEQKVAEWRKPT